MNQQVLDAPLELNNKRTINGWAFFDWANSVYSLVISTAIFPIYFIAWSPDLIKIFGVEYSNESVYSFVISASYLLIAFLSPFLSGIADAGGKRMKFLKFFTILGAIGCSALFFFKDETFLWLGILGFTLGTIGYAGSLVFYNSYLPQIATEDQFDRVSAKGYAYGYIGSVILLLMILVMVLKPEWFGFPDTQLGSRIGFMLVGLWWIGFAQITFRRMPKDSSEPSEPGLIKKGFVELRLTFKKVMKDINVRRFLLSFLFFSAGVNTIIYVASIFASEEIGFKEAELIALILILQLVAVLGAYFFAFVSKRRGNKFSLAIQIVIWFLLCIAAYYTTTKTTFYVLVGLVGLVLGGVQSLARSSYTKLLDDDIDDPIDSREIFDILRSEY